MYLFFESSNRCRGFLEDSSIRRLVTSSGPSSFYSPKKQTGPAAINKRYDSTRSRSNGSTSSSNSSGNSSASINSSTTSNESRNDDANDKYSNSTSNSIKGP